MKKLMNLICVTIALLMVFAWCGSGQSSQPTTPAAPAANAGNQPVIGFSNVTMTTPFYRTLCDNAQTVMEGLGARVIVLDAQNDITKQNNDIADFVTQGVDAIIINPVDPDGVAPSLRIAEAAGIPVFSVDRPVSGGTVTAHIGRENRDMGRLMGDLAVELLGGVGNANGKIVEIMGAAGCMVQEARSAGFHDAVDAESGLTVVQTPFCDYELAKAVMAMQDIVQAHRDIVLVYAHNDDMGIGGLQVLTQNGIDAYVVSVDGLMEAVKMIADPDSKYSGTTINDPILFGVILGETVMKVLDGQSVPAFVDAGTGTINKANAAQFVDDNLMYAPAAR